MSDPVPLRLDPNPCRYPWDPHRACPEVYPGDGGHVCRYPGGHEGLCCCAYCGAVGIRRRRDREKGP